DQYQSEARELQDSVFYRFGVEGRETAFIKREILALMTDFGAEGYAIPPEFVNQVERFVERLQTRDRAIVEGVLGANREKFSTMREIFSSHKLPPDLAYMVLVESAFITQSKSSKGAVGLWQFTPATARAYGLTVNAEVDDRHDLTKSTHAAAKYVRELILEFGAGSSVMLALAAYNYGPRRVKRAVKRVEDPINQRNFWYLYEKRALPIETRQYVPKIIAAIIIGRNPERFGF
ncbi:MAG: lytic transglycosylase domain-containing protein, partial [bacterium]|nr:lytic transglycosylase domain-containing protein [bacterium]